MKKLFINNFLNFKIATKYKLKFKFLNFLFKFLNFVKIFILDIMELIVNLLDNLDDKKEVIRIDKIKFDLEEVSLKIFFMKLF